MKLTSSQILEQLKLAYDPDRLYPRLEKISLLGRMTGVVRFRSRIKDRERRVDIFPKQDRVEFPDFPHKGYHGIYIAGERVEYYRGSQLIASRESPRDFFFHPRKGIRRLFWTDILDNIYFHGYAIMHYFTFPYQLDNDNIKIINRGLVSLPDKYDRKKSKELLEIEVVFPESVHVHCAVEYFYLDPNTFLLDRLVYHVDTFRLLFDKVVHFCFDYESYQGLIFPRKRRIFIRSFVNLFYKKRLDDWKNTITMWSDIKDIQISLRRE